MSSQVDVNAALPQYIISLDDARAALGMAFNASAAKDQDLLLFIAAATPIMEDLVGPIVSCPRVETYDGGRAQIALLHSPLVSVTSVVESYGSTYERTLTPQSRFDGTPVTAYGYDIDLATGLLTRLVSGVVAPFPGGRRNIQVSYVSGRATVSRNIILATRILVRHLWLLSGQQGLRPVLGAPDTSVGRTPSGFAVPNAVIEMVSGADTRIPGIA